jgi:acetyl-CoA carboxylase carboxyltransferase component
VTADRCGPRILNGQDQRHPVAAVSVPQVAVVAGHRVGAAVLHPGHPVAEVAVEDAEDSF